MYTIYISECHTCRMELLPHSANKHEHINVVNKHCKENSHLCSVYAQPAYQNKNDFPNYNFGTEVIIFTAYPEY